ncbi:MAG TPA: phosphate ABC transporter permease subunit PstC [Thermoplasmata archaeon]|nr:phosphate ABC transporter permease subunit PstC [Thermoplasmata archaeon]
MANRFVDGLLRRFRRRGPVHLGDLLFHGITAAIAVGLLGIVLALVVVLYSGANPSIVHYGFSFLTGNSWDPNHAVYGLLPIIQGTLVTSAVALLISVPLSVGAAVFLSEHAPRWLRDPVGYVVELLAAIPSVIYGFWGLLVLRPFMRTTIEPFLQWTVAWVPGAIGGTPAGARPVVAVLIGWGPALFAGTPQGLDLLTASVVLAVMVTPTISAISRESIAAVPNHQREAALSLGATRWESTRMAVLSYARVGIVGGIILGLGRALGETMAITMTIGNSDSFSGSLLVPGQTIASLIANKFTEATEPFHQSALIEAGLVLLAITLVVNVLARLLVWRVVRRPGETGA